MSIELFLRCTHRSSLTFHTSCRHLLIACTGEIFSICKSAFYFAAFFFFTATILRKFIHFTTEKWVSFTVFTECNRYGSFHSHCRSCKPLRISRVVLLQKIPRLGNFFETTHKHVLNANVKERFGSWISSQHLWLSSTSPISILLFSCENWFRKNSFFSFIKLPCGEEILLIFFYYASNSD